MQKRRLGRTDLEIAPLVLGGNVFGWTADEKTSFDVLDRFAAAGLNAVDTADVYSRWAPGHQGGESETIIGKWMKSRGNRDRIVLITKVGSDMGQGKRDLSAAYIEKAVEASLKRLQTDIIDLYLSHWPDDPTVGYEETLGAYERLIEKGKIRYCRRLQSRCDRAARRARRLAKARPAALRGAAARIQPLRPLELRRAAARRCAWPPRSASSATSGWPGDFSPASTAARPISAKARAAAAFRNT